MFPLADLPKPEVSAYWKERGLPIVSREIAEDLCFIEEGRLAHFVEQRNDSVAVDGEIVDHTGRVVGRHQGLHHLRSDNEVDWVLPWGTHVCETLR